MIEFDWVRDWVREAPYAAVLGLRVDQLSGEQALVSAGFKEELSNGDNALHGGVAASIIVTCAGCVTRAALGPDTGPWHTGAVQVSYLAAALGEGIRARAKLLRKGKELAHIEVDLEGESGKAVAKGLLTVRARHGAQPTVAVGEAGGLGTGVGEDDRGPMGPYIGSVPFHATLGMSAEHMAGGTSRIAMPKKHSNAGPDGEIHEGAIMALIDTTGAMAAWAKTGPGRFKASTPVLQARIFDAEPRGDLVGHGRVVHQDREMLFCDVEIRSADEGRSQLVADGKVNYRIVTTESGGS